MANTNSKADEQIEYHKTFETGGTRLRTILIGLRLEVKIPGMRMTRKAPKCSTILRREFGMHGTPANLLAQYTALLDKHGMLPIENPVDNVIVVTVP
jgi:hypothetical protein